MKKVTAAIALSTFHDWGQDVQQGQPVEQFEEFPAKLMHLTIVSNNLQYFIS